MASLPPSAHPALSLLSLSVLNTESITEPDMLGQRSSPLPPWPAHLIPLPGQSPSCLGFSDLQRAGGTQDPPSRRAAPTGPFAAVAFLF